jgi:gliding motility-associated-like protein
VQGLCKGLTTVTVYDSLGCFAVDTVLVTAPPPVSVVVDSVQPHCWHADGMLMADSSAGGTSPYIYTWDNNLHGKQLKGTTTGLHILTVTDSLGCVYHIPIYLAALYPHVTAAPDTSIYAGTSVKLRTTGALRYVWFPATHLSCDTCINPVYAGMQTMLFCVQGTDSFGCTDTACAHIYIRHDCGIPFLPDAFTPNGDHKDDILHVLGNCLATAHLIIYNRWGQALFESYKLTEGWNGTYLGQPCQQDVYVWVMDATNLFGEVFHQKGDVTLIR